MGYRRFPPQLVPYRIWVFDKGGIEMIEIACPIGNRCTPGDARSPAHSISIASSGQLALASQALPSRVEETQPSAISWASQGINLKNLGRASARDPGSARD